ncbi:ecto-NOX disulfide-thiol exchanger 2-like [Tubulanus polymorphus]|uniref:ecto-NOX disulfide-thiol exchanger 2-like n=1 Tax=Tubulanus polymorphus TaxID=672921 RepID=UPI003DA4D8FE
MSAPYFMGMQGCLGGMVNVPPPPIPPNIDPAYNNQPLQFNASSSTSNTDDSDNMYISNSPGPSGATTESSPPQGPPPQMMPNMMGMSSFGPMISDPSMMNQMMMGPAMGYGQFPGYIPSQHPITDYQQQMREPLRVKGAVLMPPPSGAPPRTTRERPPGCRTIFVGGIPEDATEDHLREIFNTCGPINSLRLSKKNFAHIRFMSEEFIDRCLVYSGWRLKVGEDAEETRVNTGRIHVDYAQARDDQYEWECNQRALAREYRHFQRIEEERLRPPSPPPIIHFSDHEALQLQDKLKDDEIFPKATQVLVTWLERGDCKSRTANVFYSLIQTTNSHVRRLMNEKTTHDDELNAMKDKFRQRMEGLLRQFDQIEKVFVAATKQKAWDHFSKAQRKNLLLWKNQSEDIRKQSLEDFLNERNEDNMDLSDSEDEPVKKKQRPDSTVGSSNVSHLREENDSLKCQLEAYKNEIDHVKQEGRANVAEKESQLKLLQQALQNTQQQLLSSRTQKLQDDDEIKQLRQKLASTNESSSKTLRGTREDIDRANEPTTSESNQGVHAVSTSVSDSDMTPLNSRQAKLIGVISTFLHVHPFGASTDYICSYLSRLNLAMIRASEIEDLLERLPSVFRRDTHGVGASIEKRWVFTALN